MSTTPVSKPQGSAWRQALAHRPYSVWEEAAHAISHGLAAVASVLALTVMVAMAALHGAIQHVVAVSVYGASLILLYTASTLYHSIPLPRARKVLHTLDHAAIYILIAGSYTPFALVALDDSSRWWLLGLVWTMATLGVIFKLFFTGRFDKVSVALYLAMGWLVVFFAEPVMAALSPQGLLWLAAGGIAYTIGAVFYLWRGLKHNHTIWHVFVVAGSALQFMAVWTDVIPHG